MMIYHSTHIDSFDPRLQYYLSRLQSMAGKLRFASAAEGFVPIIAIVTDQAAWEALSEVKTGASIPMHDGKFIVTARIPISRVEEIRKCSFVETLKATQSLKPALKEINQEIGLEQHTIGSIEVSKLQETSKDVVVGVVGYGADFVNQSFRNQDGTTRISRLWDQAGTASARSPFGYGREFTNDTINAALNKADPYTALGYEPRDFDLNGNSELSHGTFLMDIAAGAGSVTDDGRKNSIGVAPLAELVFVELNAETPHTMAEIIDSDFGDSVRLVEAVKYIFDYADSVGKPCVVNLSLNTNGGPHDGTNPVERAFDALVNAKPGRAIVIAASNNYAENMHHSGMVVKDGFSDVQLSIPQFDKSSNEAEIWYDGRDEFEVEIFNKNDESVAKISLGKNGYINEVINGHEVLRCFISHRKNDPNNGDNVIHFFEYPRNQATDGSWKLRLHAVNVVNGTYHAWIERDDIGQSSFIKADKTRTLGSISCGHQSIVVGAYDESKPAKPILYYSSAGPTRDGRRKPDVSAPGSAVWATNAGVDSVIRRSGTSVATATVTGLVALMFGYSKFLGKELHIDTILQILETALHHVEPADIKNWNDRYGYGRISGDVFNHSFFSQLPAPQPETSTNTVSSDISTDTPSPAGSTSTRET